MSDRRHGFDTVAADYDAARPGYPGALYDDLAAMCGLGPGARVLEVGCGTGQATQELAGRGASVTAIELGPALAALARDRMARSPEVEVVTAAFEEWTAPPERFDLAVSATAFHWLDAETALPKVADAVRPGGWIALWWHVYGDPDRPDPWHDAAQPVFERWRSGGHRDTGRDGALEAAERAATDIDRTGRFGPVEARRYRWEGVHTAAELRRLFATYSPTIAMAEPDRSRFLDELAAIATDRFGGVVTRPYLTVLYAAQRR